MPKLRKGIDFNDTYTCQEKDFYCLGQRSWSKNVHVNITFLQNLMNNLALSGKLNVSLPDL